MKSTTIKKDKSTPEKAEFWKSVEDAANEIGTWPEWKRNFLSSIFLDESPRPKTRPEVKTPKGKGR